MSEHKRRVRSVTKRETGRERAQLQLALIRYGGEQKAVLLPAPPLNERNLAPVLNDARVAFKARVARLYEFLMATAALSASDPAFQRRLEIVTQWFRQAPMGRDMLFELRFAPDRSASDILAAYITARFGKKASVLMGTVAVPGKPPAEAALAAAAVLEKHRRMRIAGAMLHARSVCWMT